MSPKDVLASPRRWYVLGAAAVGALSATVMATAVNVAMPSLVEVFDTKFAVVQWVLLAYLLATTALLPVIGRLSDTVGKKRIFMAGFAFFVLGSALCALAPSVALLIAFRTLQGVGSAVLTALGLAIVTDVFPAGERGRAIGINGAVLSSGIVVGPALGGLLLDVVSWRWVFGIGVPMGLLGALLAWRFVPWYGPETRGGERPRGSFDVAGSATLVGGLLSLSLALTLGQARAFDDPLIVALFTLAGLLLASFLWVERRAENPVLDLRLFTLPALSVGLLSGLATFIAIAGTIFLMPFYLENILGYSAREVGLLMSVVPVVLVIIAPIAGSLADRYGERGITVVGLLLLLGGYLAVGGLDEDTGALEYILRFLPVGMGMGTFQSPNNSAIMGAVSRTRSGVAGGLLALTRYLGQTAGIALLGSLWAARVAVRAGAGVGAEASAAPAAAQIGGLHDMLLVIQLMIGAALLLCVWDWWAQRRRAAAGAGASAD